MFFHRTQHPVNLFVKAGKTNFPGLPLKQMKRLIELQSSHWRGLGYSGLATVTLTPVPEKVAIMSFYQSASWLS